MDFGFCDDDDERGIEEMNKLLIFFSVGGVTRRIASYMDMPGVEIRAVWPYTDADILAANPKARVNVEQGNPNCRPEMFFNGQADTYLSSGNTEIYLGFPLWNLKAPRIIFTLLDELQYRCDGNIINVFCTSGGSPISGAEKELKETYPDLHWGKFKQFSYTSSKEEVRRWIQS